LGSQHKSGHTLGRGENGGGGTEPHKPRSRRGRCVAQKNAGISKGGVRPPDKGKKKKRHVRTCFPLRIFQGARRRGFCASLRKNLFWPGPPGWLLPRSRGVFHPGPNGGGDVSGPNHGLWKGEGLGTGGGPKKLRGGAGPGFCGGAALKRFPPVGGTPWFALGAFFCGFGPSGAGRKKSGCWGQKGGGAPAGA